MFTFPLTDNWNCSTLFQLFDIVFAILDQSCLGDKNCINFIKEPTFYIVNFLFLKYFINLLFIFFSSPLLNLICKPFYFLIKAFIIMNLSINPFLKPTTIDMISVLFFN